LVSINYEEIGKRYVEKIIEYLEDIKDDLGSMAELLSEICENGTGYMIFGNTNDAYVFDDDLRDICGCVKEAFNMLKNEIEKLKTQIETKEEQQNAT
jgi:archaellum component FlaC